MKNTLTLLALIAIGTINAQQEPTSVDSIQQLDPVFINSQVIFGSKYEAKNRTGSSFYISPKELEKYTQVFSNKHGFINKRRALICSSSQRCKSSLINAI